MGTRPPKASAIAAALVFALSVFGFTLFIWISFGGTTPLEAKGYRFGAQFRSEAAQLTTNADVRISGVNVGKVVELKRGGGQINAQIELDSEYAPVPSDARVILRTKTLLGETFVEMTPGSPSAPKLKEGQTLPASQTAPVQQLDEVLGSFDAPTRAALKRFLNDFADSFTDRGPDLNAALGNAGPAVRDITDVVEILDQQRPVLRDLVRDSGQALQAIGSRQSDLQSLVTAGNEVFAATAERNRELTATINALPPFLAELNAALVVAERVAVRAGPVLRTLRPVASLVRPALDAANRLAPELEATFKQLGPVLDAAEEGVPSLQEITDLLRPLTRQLYASGRELVPVTQMLNAFKQEGVTALSNTAASLNGAFHNGPNGQPVHYLRSMIPITNMLPLGAAAQREPNDRHNPYFAPGALAKFPNWEAFDCMNVANPQVVAPIAGSAPPCRAQAPWTFRGETRSYPHVTRDGP